MSALDPTTAYVLIVIFVATLIRSTLGFGEALVAVPLLALRTPIKVAAPLAVLVSVVVAGVIVAQDWRKVDVRSAFWLILSAACGIPVGIFLLARTNDHVVKLILGFIIVAFSSYSLIAKPRLILAADHWGWLLGCGFLSGILGGAYGMNGPPLAIYGGLRQWSPQQFRATLQGYFLPASLMGLVGYAAIGLWEPEITRYFVFSLPGIAAAIFIGRSLNRRMKSNKFFRTVLVGLLGIGFMLLIQAMKR